MVKRKTLRELTVCYAEKAGVKNTEAKRAFEVLSEIIMKELKATCEFNLFGLGKLKVAKTKARKGINPLTHKPMTIKAKTKIKFRPSKDLKEKAAKF